MQKEIIDVDKKNKLIRRYCYNYHLEEKNISYDMIIKHWTLERELAKKMRECERSNRTEFFKDCYHILYTSCPWLVSTGMSDSKRSDWINWCINSTLPKKAQILEIGGGAGNCAKNVCEKGFFLTCIDISEERVSQAKMNNQESNIAFHVGDATNLKFPHDSFDVVYSHQMIEHLHPDDVLYHFQEVYKILKKGGFYYFTTPNSLWGPHDVSRVFGCKKTYGMHLKEYSYSEITTILQASGFNILKTPLIHPFICHKLGLIPPSINSNKKNRWESSIRLLPDPLNKIISTLSAINSIMITAIK